MDALTMARGMTKEDALRILLHGMLPALFEEFPMGVTAQELVHRTGHGYSRCVAVLRQLDRLRIVRWAAPAGTRIKLMTPGIARNAPLPKPRHVVTPMKTREMKACVRAADPPPARWQDRNVTRLLMGDPPPGRTPWAAP